VPPRPLVAVTDHAAERFRQRVGSRRGAVDVRPEIVARVADAVAAGRTTTERTGVLVRDAEDPHVVYVCRPEGGELVVVTLWEDEEAPGGPRVPRRFTDALRESDRAVRDRRDP
jgi:hypothetical protein